MALARSRSEPVKLLVNWTRFLLSATNFWVVGVQCVDEQRQAAHHGEEVAAAFVEGCQRPRKGV